MGERMPQPADPAADVIARLTRRGLRLAVAESLTGGLVVAELTRIPGASLVVNGGVVAYDTDVKRSLLGVSAELLAREGAVHPEVARQMADRVRAVLAVDGRPAEIGIATTGVAGPTEQDGKPAGTVFVGVAFGEDVEAIALDLPGDRSEIRAATVRAAIEALLDRL
ncbi:CinA family protein [Agromyces sp. H66]|uniref:CinA family protein n=1 Tax=Agromyces sp. H66 TaxID=2529859 RepID=UPI0020BD7C9E|nr:CinA family protein [Agromyces sp. H66]